MNRLSKFKEIIENIWPENLFKKWSMIKKAKRNKTLSSSLKISFENNNKDKLKPYKEPNFSIQNPLLWKFGMCSKNWPLQTICNNQSIKILLKFILHFLIAIENLANRVEVVPIEIKVI